MRTFLCSLLALEASAYVLQQPPMQQRHAERAAAPQMAATKVSRRKAKLDELVDAEKLYAPDEAVALLKKTASAKFVETAELHGNLNLDPKYNDQQIRTTVSLPAGTGKDVRVAVLADGPAADAAKEAGADLVGMNDLIETISSGELDFGARAPRRAARPPAPAPLPPACTPSHPPPLPTSVADILLATPPAMPKLAKLGKVLGPKGLMPSPKAGTVSADPGAAVKEFKAGKLEFRCDKQGIVHVPFGKMDFDEDGLLKNLIAVRDTIEKNRPVGCKGKLWNTAALSTTMGPSIKLDLVELKAFGGVAA